MQQTDEYWEQRFNYMTKQPPECVKRAIRRVYEAYPERCLPQGVCDPMYIMNVICKELGVGDGEGNFPLLEGEDERGE